MYINHFPLFILGMAPGSSRLAVMKSRSFACDCCSRRFLSLRTFTSHVPVCSVQKPHHVCYYCLKRVGIHAHVGRVLAGEFSGMSEFDFVCPDCQDSKVEPELKYPEDVMAEAQYKIRNCSKIECQGVENCETCVGHFRKMADIVVNRKDYQEQKRQDKKRSPDNDEMSISEGKIRRVTDDIELLCEALDNLHISPQEMM